MRIGQPDARLVGDLMSLMSDGFEQVSIGAVGDVEGSRECGSGYLDLSALGGPWELGNHIDRLFS